MRRTKGVNWVYPCNQEIGDAAVKIQPVSDISLRAFDTKYINESWTSGNYVAPGPVVGSRAIFSQINQTTKGAET
jgi:hypothetical protein